MFGFFQNRLHYFMKISKVILLLLSAAFFSFVTVKAQVADPPFLQYIHHPWVDSVLNTLTPDQRISQCIWVAGWSDGDISHEVELAEMIKADGPGGIIFFQGTPDKQVELTNYYQKISKVPLIIAMDAEWGPAMRLSGVEKFPYQMTLGAIRNDSLIYQFAKSVA
jgi:beta-N-acetylhexosaminidase